MRCNVQWLRVTPNRLAYNLSFFIVPAVSYVKGWNAGRSFFRRISAAHRLLQGSVRPAPAGCPLTACAIHKNSVKTIDTGYAAKRPADRGMQA